MPPQARGDGSGATGLDAVLRGTGGRLARNSHFASQANQLLAPALALAPACAPTAAAATVANGASASALATSANATATAAATTAATTAAVMPGEQLSSVPLDFVGRLERLAADWARLQPAIDAAPPGLGAAAKQVPLDGTEALGDRQPTPARRRALVLPPRDGSPVGGQPGQWPIPGGGLAGGSPKSPPQPPQPPQPPPPLPELPEPPEPRRPSTVLHERRYVGPGSRGGSGGASGGSGASAWATYLPGGDGAPDGRKPWTRLHALLVCRRYLQVRRCASKLAGCAGSAAPLYDLLCWLIGLTLQMRRAVALRTMRAWTTRFHANASSSLNCLSIDDASRLSCHSCSTGLQ